MGFGIILPVLPYYALEYGASATEVALLSTTFSAAQFLMSPVLGQMSDRIGRRPVMMISIAGSCLGALTLGLAHALWIFYLARLISGASKANISTAHAYVADVVAPADRARYMGLMGAAMGAGFIFGPALGGLLAFEGMPQLPFYVSAGLSAVNLLMAWRWLPETLDRSRRVSAAVSQARGRIEGFKRILGTHMAWVVALTFMYYLAFASMESTMALLAEKLFGWGGRENGFFMTYVGVVIVVAQGVLVGRFVSRMGEGFTLIIGMASVAFGLGVLGGIDIISAWLSVPLHGDYLGASWQSLALYGLGGMGLAAGNGLVIANLSAITSVISSADTQGWNLGLKESAAALARIGGPAAAGLAFEYITYGAPLLGGSAVAALGVFVAMHLRRRLLADGLQ
jgi:DHA1 family tetracycline resistance protein-like MFS transporter